MIKKIEHIGIAVESLEKSIPLFEQLLNSPCYKTEEVNQEKVKTSFFTVGEAKIELLESTSLDGPISKFLTKRGEGIHHIAFEVDDIEAELGRLKELGFQIVGGPTPGADNRLVAFVHPKTANGVLVELCQEI